MAKHPKDLNGTPRNEITIFESRARPSKRFLDCEQFERIYVLLHWYFICPRLTFSDQEKYFDPQHFNKQTKKLEVKGTHFSSVTSVTITDVYSGLVILNIMDLHKIRKKYCIPKFEYQIPVDHRHTPIDQTYRRMSFVLIFNRIMDAVKCIF